MAGGDYQGGAVDGVVGAGGGSMGGGGMNTDHETAGIIDAIWQHDYEDPHDKKYGDVGNIAIGRGTR